MRLAVQRSQWSSERRADHVQPLQRGAERLVQTSWSCTLTTDDTARVPTCGASLKTPKDATGARVDDGFGRWASGIGRHRPRKVTLLPAALVTACSEYQARAMGNQELGQALSTAAVGNGLSHEAQRVQDVRTLVQAPLRHATRRAWVVLTGVDMRSLLMSYLSE